ncbi:MAG: endonuclease III [Bacteroidaceae bacterium]|nr:endonuclease III [Bacteroidaceae bacterium]
MRKKELFAHVLDYFARTMDDTETELDYRNHFELLVAVVLSAQCTDKRINMVTPRLFADYPTAEAMAQATPEVIFEYIKTVSYPNNKAKNLVGLAQKLVKDFDGVVPSTLEELTSLPGVGRKTANVVQAVAFHKAALAVDTHVFRVSHRLGLVPKSATTPLAVEKALMKYIPTDQVAAGHYWILLHGRYVCIARKPKCSQCGLAEVCPSRKKFEAS